MFKYGTILSDMERKLTEGKYKPGEKLPSVRLAARQYGCSVSTIIRAYAELEKRHAIYSVAQSGYYAVDKPGEPADTAYSTGGAIDFATGSPDVNVFPYRDFQHCLNKAIDTYKHQLFSYGEASGMERLRRTLVSHLADSQVFASAERIMVTSGAQQALEILAKMPFPNGKSVILTEQPSYDLYLRYLEAERIPVAGIARTMNGIDLHELEDKFKRGNIKFFYTMSRYHNPLGTSYRPEESKAIAALAGKYDVYIVEDDYMADLGEECDFEPIYAYNRTSHVVYVKSFSKIVFPGLRLGAVVLPERLLEPFRRYRTYPDTSLLSQAALDIYIGNGMYERHKRQIAGRYAERMQALNEAVRRHNKSGIVRIPVIGSGLHTQFKLPQTVNLEQLALRLEARRVNVVPGKKFYLTRFLEREKFVRVSISRVSAEQIDEGVKAIIEEAGRGSR